MTTVAREQGNREAMGEVSKEDCTHFYWRLTLQGPFNHPDSRFIGWTCGNPNCELFEKAKDWANA